MRTTRRAGRIIFRSVIAVAMLIIGTMSAVHVIANISSDQNPDLALRFAANHPVAMTKKAEMLLQMGRLGDAERLARASVSYAALPSESYEVLGLVQARRANEDRAEQLFEYSARLSRRGVPTQMWLFNSTLQKGRIQSALRHLDAAMRVSGRGRAALYPVLGAALSHGALVEPVAELLTRNPLWLGGFLTYAFNNDVPLGNVADIITSLPSDSPARTPDMQAALIEALVKKGQYQEAWRFYQAIASGQSKGLIRDATFRVRGNYPPFDWSYTKGIEAGASPTSGSEGGLKYYADAGRGGLVARQLLVLPTGDYRFETEGRKLSSDRDGSATWTLICTTDEDRQLLRLDAPRAAGETNSVGRTLTVPEAGCSTQWLDLTLHATFSPGGLEGLIRQVRVQPLARGSDR